MHREPAVAVQRGRILVGRIAFDARTRAQATREILDLASRKVAMPVRLSNAWCVVVAQDNDEYASALAEPGLTYSDGRPVARELRRRGATEAEQVRGPTLFEDVLDQGRAMEVRHFFLGSTPEVIARLREEVQRRYPGIIVCGWSAPPFGPLDAAFYQAATESIGSAAPDIVWIGMGTPKQDLAAVELARLSGRPCVGVGAAFDFVAGTAREAPTFIRRAGLEWLFRLLSEPRRLWRRYLIGNVRFLWIAGRDHL